jgi:hypothetical protein
MPRTGDVYSLPANSLATTLTAISSSRYNAALLDLVQDLNTARPVAVGGTGATTAAGARTNLGLGALATLASMADLTDGDSWTAEADVASGATTDILAATSDFIRITGTTTITSFGTGTNKIKFVRFAAALTLTHNATSLILPTGANIVTAAGDTAIVISDGSSNARVLAYQRASGRPLVTPVAGDFKNLSVVVTGNAAVDVDADAITLENTSGDAFRATAVDLTANMGSSGANGLDTGTEAADTWYSVWVIYNPTTGTVASLLSTSATSPTMPSGYTFKARAGWVRNNASSNLYRTLQKGDRAVYVLGTNPAALIVIQSGTTGSVTVPTWTSLATGAYVPTTASAITVQARGTTDDSSGSIVAPNNSYGARSSSTITPPWMTGLDGAGSQVVSLSERFDLVLESTNIYAASSDTDFRLFAVGWVDNL